MRATGLNQSYFAGLIISTYAVHGFDTVENDRFSQRICCIASIYSRKGVTQVGREAG
jgi:hypothetical protein